MRTSLPLSRSLAGQFRSLSSSSSSRSPSLVDLAIDLRTSARTAEAIRTLTVDRLKQVNDRFGAVALHLDDDELTVNASTARAIGTGTGSHSQWANAATAVDSQLLQQAPVPADFKLPLLAGIPISIKDNFSVKGTKTTAGSAILENYRSPYDATVIENLRNCGGIPAFKVNMDEFGMGSSMLNSSFGPCVNPWSIPGNVKQRLTPGGSSGASAVSVACGLVAASIGSDTGGSIRQPAAYCGVVGLKPTYGLLSRHGLVSYASSMDTPGVITSNVTDAALLLDVLSSGHDTRDATSVRSPADKVAPLLFGDMFPSWPVVDLASLERLKRKSLEPVSCRGLVVGVPDEFVVSELDVAAGRAWENSLRMLADAGAIIKRVSLPSLRLALPCYYVLACAEASSNLSRYDGVRYGVRSDSPEASSSPENENEKHEQKPLFQGMVGRSRGKGFGPEVIKRVLTGTFVLSESYYHAYYERACVVRRALQREMEAIFCGGGVHLLAGLTAPNLPFPLDSPPDPAQMLVNDFLTVSANLAGIPAVSLPVCTVQAASSSSSSSSSKHINCNPAAAGEGKEQMLPVGLQLLGPRFGEQTLLQAALAVEQRAGFAKQIPDHVYLL